MCSRGKRQLTCTRRGRSKIERSNWWSLLTEGFEYRIYVGELTRHQLQGLAFGSDNSKGKLVLGIDNVEPRSGKGICWWTDFSNLGCLTSIVQRLFQLIL